MGAQVVMTRTDDIAISQEQRVKIGNDKKADIFVSIHLNSSANETANGAEAWIHSSKPNNSLKLSKTILEEIAINTGIHNRDVKYGTLADSKENYYINSRSKSASLILELGFITSNSDMLVINNKTEHIAKAIASGIAKYLNGGDKGESGKY
jgi:N-acetylmuramoyl-L-alanine amidase